MTGVISDLVRWGSVDPEDILTQALAKVREERRAGAQSVGVVVGRVTVAADGRKFYDVFYSQICGDEMLWLAKRIEQEAISEENEE